jgi:N-acetyl sugar amidotransferase
LTKNKGSGKQQGMLHQVANPFFFGAYFPFSFARCANMSNYQQCTNCVMDTTDPAITFDEQGVCSHCYEFHTVTRKNWFPNEEGARRLSAIVEQIKKDGARQQYDCILGLSGGVDSSYLALKASEWKLRPLVMHVDAGWNSELSVSNIEKIIQYCGYDLQTHVVDWEEMRDLQLAYLRSGIANQDVPQDHIYFASLYHFATRHRIKTILSGGNIATESVFASAWHGAAMDSINLRAIHARYGDRRLVNYKTISFFETYIWYPFVKGMKSIRPLNYMRYDKESAIQELQSRIGYRDYGRKHGESFFTKLFQNYYLPTKFGYDKRRVHFSSMILSGQLSRARALDLLDEPLYDPAELESDITYFCKKMRITRVQFNDFMKAPLHHHSDFPTWEGRYRTLKRVQRIVESAFGRRIKVYS